MLKLYLVVGIVGVLLLVGLFYNTYKIPTLIEDDYDCKNHPGFISDSNPAPFESPQHYVNRKGKAIQKQIEEVCD